ncbi:hypothetical protein AGMMS49921_12940 [Endomicrobiia bacterium]|nr:hypothetical protein AGMMS49921_12940 [Endomicrobiia bacterium]
MKRDRDHAVVIKKMGFQTEHRNITSNLQAVWLITDIILGAGIAFIVPIIDAATGAWYGFLPIILALT